ncbi:MAG: TIGR02757 family protein [bacterium]
MTFQLDTIRNLLESAYKQYNIAGFIESDPVCIPHRFSRKEDIEISAFLAATIAWGNRPAIICNADRLMKMMDDTPYDFVLNASPKEKNPILHFAHRTFNGTDCLFFLESLKNIYLNHGGLENLFSRINEIGVRESIIEFRKTFLERPHQKHVEKHLSDPLKGSSAKRLNLFLRWMVRKDAKGVDFGLWRQVSPAHLICPLDVHVARVARKFGLLNRKSNDWKAAEELTESLSKFDNNDPVKYDLALFGLGAAGRF